MREVQAADVRNGMIAATLEQVRYLTAKGLVIEQKAAHVRGAFMVDV
jgi:hypothetical protein